MNAVWGSPQFLAASSLKQRQRHVIDVSPELRRMTRLNFARKAVQDACKHAAHNAQALASNSRLAAQHVVQCAHEVPTTAPFCIDNTLQRSFIMLGRRGRQRACAAAHDDIEVRPMLSCDSQRSAIGSAPAREDCIHQRRTTLGFVVTWPSTSNIAMHSATLVHAPQT